MTETEIKTETTLKNEVDRLVDTIAQRLDGIAIPRPPDGASRALAEEFIGFLGKLTAFFENEQPSVAKGAAILVFMQRMGLDRVGDQNAHIMMTMIDATSEVLANRGAS